MSHTFAILELHPQAYLEIREKLLEAGYTHAVVTLGNEEEAIDMHGIGLQQAKTMYEVSPGKFAEMSMSTDVPTLQKLCRNSYAMYRMIHQRLTATRQRLRDAFEVQHPHAGDELWGQVEAILAEEDPEPLAMSNPTRLPGLIQAPNYLAQADGAQRLKPALSKTGRE